MRSALVFGPVFATIVGIGLFSAMDAVMKGAALAVGAYSAVLLRNLVGTLLMLPWWLWTGRRMPGPAAWRVHLKRSAVVAVMAVAFFFSLTRLPLAEAIALSFIAPLIALYLAALLLGETIERKAVVGALLSFAGVAAIIGSKLGQEAPSADMAVGLAALLFSALLYAWNLVIQREQALIAGPGEVALFQSALVALVLSPAAPLLWRTPGGETVALIAVGAVLAVLALLCLTWAYARAEAQVLVPVEYTGFLWAALFGWIMFAEPLTAGLVGGALLIVAGCWIATRKRPAPPEQSVL